jgi:hypothetical protein
MTKKDEALRQTAKFLITLANRLPESAKEIKDGLEAHANLCALALPNRLRFTYGEIRKMRGVKTSNE